MPVVSAIAIAIGVYLFAAGFLSGNAGKIFGGVIVVAAGAGLFILTA